MGANDLLAATAGSAAVIERATVHPWVVAVGYHFEPGVHHMLMQVVERRMDDRPDPLGLLPVGAELNRAEVFPAARFEDMPAETRERWMPHYRAFLMWRKAKSLGKHVAEMQSWVDYDAILIDESVQRWAKPGVRYTGD